jgi:hypothetical protein
MDFNEYVNQLNNLDKQDAKSELENFYFFNSGVLQFFKGIDSQVQAILNAPAINPKGVEQVIDILQIMKFIRKIRRFTEIYPEFPAKSLLLSHDSE